MSYPDFDAKEKYLVSVLKSTGASQYWNPFMWAYMLSTALLFGFSAYYRAIAGMIIAFMVIMGMRLYEDWYNNRIWRPVWGRIIAKFEAALDGTQTDGDDQAG